MRRSNVSPWASSTSSGLLASGRPPTEVGKLSRAELIRLNPILERLTQPSTALVPTDTSDVSRSSRSTDASDDLDAHGHIDTLNLSAGGRKVAGSNPVAPTA